MGHGRPHQLVGGGNVEVERLLEVGGVGGEQGVRDGAADVVHDDVEPAELLLGRVGEGGDRVEVAEVGLDDDRPASERPDASGHLVELMGRARRDEDVGTGFGQPEGRRRADAAAGAGDHGDPVVDGEPVENHTNPCRSEVREKCNRF